MLLRRKCTKCGEEKKFKNFRILRRKLKKIVRQSWCTDCVRIYVRERYRTNQKYRENQLQRRRTPEARKTQNEYMRSYRKKRMTYFNRRGVCRYAFIKIGLYNQLREEHKICQICGANILSYTAVVHHIDKNFENNDMNNLQVICRSCHAKIHNKS